MNELYPIIRRVRRPLLPPEDMAGPVVPEPQVEISAALVSAAGESLKVTLPTSGTRTEARQKKGKAD